MLEYELLGLRSFHLWYAVFRWIESYRLLSCKGIVPPARGQYLIFGIHSFKDLPTLCPPPHPVRPPEWLGSPHTPIRITTAAPPRSILGGAAVYGPGGEERGLGDEVLEGVGYTVLIVGLRD